ncbi:MAG: sulfite exporter TauE/SafE family protein [Cyclobacteriaceae bacterium]
MITLFSFELTYAQLALFVLVGLFIGMSKTGIHGAGMAAVPMLALIFGGKMSSGILLPILSIADIFAVWHYNRHAQWSHLFKLFPFAAIGVGLGTFVGTFINDESFRLFMGIIIIVSLVVMIWMEKSNKKDIPQSIWFAAVLGVAGGFTTMVGNLAGTVMALYLLSMRLPKNEYIGTAAWFFMIINLFKIPFHIFFWETINWNTFRLDLLTIPAVAIGAFLGISIVKKIPEHKYRWFIIGMTIVSALLLIV